MDSLIDQIEALRLRNKCSTSSPAKASQARRKSYSDPLRHRSQVTKQVNISAGSVMVADGRQLTFTCDGTTVHTVPCYRNFENNACGFVYSSKNIACKSITSGYSPIAILSTHQLNNNDGESVWQMCSDLDYPLARVTGKDLIYDGQFLASHVEMKALDYIYSCDMDLSVHDDCDPNGAIVGVIVIYVDRQPCFNCILFAYYFRKRTMTHVKIYYNGKEHMDLHRDRMEPLIYDLVHYPGHLYADSFADLEKYYYSQWAGLIHSNQNQPRQNEVGDALFGYTDERYSDWVEKFSHLNIERDLGKAQNRKRGLTVGFAD